MDGNPNALDASMDPLEETRFLKKHRSLVKHMLKKKEFGFDPKGVTREQYKDILHTTLDMTDSDILSKVVTALDKTPSIYITMEMWVSSMSLFLRGTLEEKIDFCFKVYDQSGNGVLGKESLFKYLRFSLKSMVSDEDAEEAVKDFIEVIMKKLDVDRDGKVSYNDYRQTVLREPSLLEVLGQCLPSRYAAMNFLTTFCTNIKKV